MTSVFEKAVEALGKIGYNEKQTLELMNQLNRDDLYIVDGSSILADYKAAVIEEKPPFVEPPLVDDVVSYTISAMVPRDKYLLNETVYNAFSSAHRDLVIAHGVDASFGTYNVSSD